MRKQKAFYLLAVTMLLFLVVTSCGLPNDQNGQGKVHPVSEVELILHQVSERDRKVGMGVGYDLQVKNHNTFPIEFAGFLNTGRQGQSYFAFSPPNAAYLIAPDGRDLFAVYSQDGPVNKQSAVYAGDTRAVIEEFDPLHVEANAERWQSFSLFQYAELWQTGTYTFWVELEDNLGQLHQSNKVNFTIEDVPPSAPIASLELDLRFEKDSYTIGELLDVDVGFHPPSVCQKAGGNSKGQTLHGCADFLLMGK